MKTVLITGASRGMGLGYAEHYLSRGWRVIATSRSPDTAVGLNRLQTSHGERLIHEPLQATQEPSIAALGQRLEQLGGGLDLLINNAGVSVGQPFGEWDSATFVQQFHTNVVGPALVAQALAPQMSADAKIINITSGLASLALNLDPVGPLAAYAVSKAALNQLTRRLAALMQPRGVTVVAINPGWVQTEMGGPHAPTPIGDAVEQITTTIEKLTLDQTGALLESNGKTMAF